MILLLRSAYWNERRRKAMPFSSLEMKLQSAMVTLQTLRNEQRKSETINGEEKAAAQMKETEKYYHEKQKIADKYIERYDPCKPLESLHFDLRAYAAYIAENKYNPRDITPDMMDQFVTGKFQ